MKPIRTAILVFVFWTVMVGGIYPLFMTGVGALFFPHQAQGSLIGSNGKLQGSHLMAQAFSTDRYFHERPSSTSYDPSKFGRQQSGIHERPAQKGLHAAQGGLAEVYRFRRRAHRDAVFLRQRRGP